MRLPAGQHVLEFPQGGPRLYSWMFGLRLVGFLPIVAITDRARAR